MSYDPQISREAFMDFFRQLILKDWEYKEAETAGLKDLLTTFIHPNDYAASLFFEQQVLGNELSERLDEHVIQMTTDMPIRIWSEESRQLYETLTQFNPGVIYHSFDKFHSDGEARLYVLERTSLSEVEKTELVQRGSKWLEVLNGIMEEIGDKKSYQPGWGRFLSSSLERLVASADPNIERSYIHTGTPIGFFSLPDSLKQFAGSSFVDNIKGLEIKGFLDPQLESLAGYQVPSIVLVNAYEKKFGQLIGKPVKYHFQETTMNCDTYGNLVPIPIGEMISDNRHL